MSFEVVRYYDGVGEVPSTIVGGSPDITATLTSQPFVNQLANAGIRAQVVSDETIPPSSYVPDLECVKAIPFPKEATKPRMSGYRPVGRLAIEITPPLDGTRQTFFERILLEATAPRYDDNRAGRKGKETRISTAELEQLVAQSEAAEAVAS